MKSLLTATLVIMILMTSCGEDEERVVEVPVPSACYPEAPRDVEVWNYDAYVTIWWWHPDPDGDLDYYVVYKSTEVDTLFEDIAVVEAESFSPREWTYYDYSTAGGEQYYYAVSAVNDAGLESELSYEIVTGTPRPEGFLRLYSNLDMPDSSGYNMVSQSSIAQYDTMASTDIYFTLDEGIPTLVVNYPEVMIQDYGFFGYDAVSFDYLHRAPLDGWANSSMLEAVKGHCYILRLGEADGIHYAKIWIGEIKTSTPDDYISFWWAYQTDAGNRDFAPAPAGYRKMKRNIPEQAIKDKGK